MFDEAADAIRREISLNQQSENIPAIGRLVVALVLVQLAREDYVAAEKAFKEWGNNCEVEEIQAMETLLRGYDEEDADVARKALHSPFIRHMDVEYAKYRYFLKRYFNNFQSPTAYVFIWLSISTFLQACERLEVTTRHCSTEQASSSRKCCSQLQIRCGRRSTGRRRWRNSTRWPVLKVKFQ